MSWMAVLSVLFLVPLSEWAAVYVDVHNVKGPWNGKF